MVEYLEVLGHPKAILLEAALSLKHLFVIDVLQAQDKSSYLKHLFAGLTH